MQPAEEQLPTLHCCRDMQTTGTKQTRTWFWGIEQKEDGLTENVSQIFYRSCTKQLRERRTTRKVVKSWPTIVATEQFARITFRRNFAQSNRRVQSLRTWTRRSPRSQPSEPQHSSTAQDNNRILPRTSMASSSLHLNPTTTDHFTQVLDPKPINYRVGSNEK